ncbi:unnamed protein product [Paramecium pentaurelia]|uniref:Uncharacterized protein n=1 Tax=Paramecium pentaurelia TaxID=43138 RepID=A0A8S1WTY4_9CILI|nr:unnamed protein product [Paramecium pentaurelia]
MCNTIYLIKRHQQTDVDTIISVPYKYKQKCIKQVQYPQLQLNKSLVLFELSIILLISTMNNTQNQQNDITQFIRYGLCVINFYNPTIKKQLNPANMEQQILQANINQTIFNIANVYNFIILFTNAYIVKLRCSFMILEIQSKLKQGFKTMLQKQLQYLNTQDYFQQLIFFQYVLVYFVINKKKINDHQQQQKPNLMIMQRPMSLLEYALSESNLSMNIKKRNLTIETQSIQTSPNLFQNNQADLELLVDMHSQNKQWVTMELFRLIIQKIEEKFNEIEQRLDNREGFQNLTQKYIQQKKMSKSYQQGDFSQMDQSQDEVESKLQISQTKRLNISQLKKSEIKEIRNDEPLIGRQNLLEKKLVQLEDKQTKIQKEINNFTLEIESKIQQCIKQIDWSLEKFNKFSQELLDKVKNVTDNHTEIFQHIQKNKEDINYVRISVEHFNQNTLTQLEQISASIINLNNFVEKHDIELKFYKEIIEITESDILKLIQFEKDILKIVYTRQEQNEKQGK